MIDRYLTPLIREDLAEKMVFLGGPRQVGKTTLSRRVLGHFKSDAYYSWDNAQHKKAALAGRWPSEKSVVVLDELHKYLRWKTWLKGQYDTYFPRLNFLVTGSAKLNVFRRRGDSLLGRYHYYCLHPFSYRECAGDSLALPLVEPEVGGLLSFSNDSDETILDRLFTFGGFPEPYIKQSPRFLRRWHRERVDLLVKDDIRSLEDVKDIELLMRLAQQLPDRVGSLLSLNSLREDLSVSHKAVSRWIGILEMVYYCYRVYPFQISALRSLKKEPKLYLWDWSEVADEGDRFENMVASHLLKYCHFLRDYFGYGMAVYFVRTREKKEVDFVVTVAQKPWFAVEVKLTDETPSKALHYFKSHLGVEQLYQVVKSPGVDFTQGGVRVMSASRFFTAFV